MCIIGPAKYLPTAIIPVIRAKINIGLAPDFSRSGLSHCCVPNSAVAVNVMQIAIKINSGVNKDFKFRTVSDSICSVSGNSSFKNRYP